MLNGTEAIQWIKENKRVAIVGLSPKEDRPSHHVGQFLKGHGFAITPIHPAHTEIIGCAAKPSLADLEPGEVDWIDLFLNPTRLMDLLPQIERLKPGLVWCQLGVIDDDFSKAVEALGVQLVVDRCPKIEWGN